MSEDKLIDQPDYYEFSEKSRSFSATSSTISNEITSRYWLHFKLMMWKQYVVFKRNLKSTLFQIGTPLIICIFLVMLQEIANYSIESMIVKNPDTINLHKIPKCWGDGCVTVGVGLTNEEDAFTDYVLRYVAEKNNLEYGKDVKILTKNDPMNLINYLSKYENKTQTAIVLCTGPFILPDSPVLNGTFDCTGNDTSYTVKMYSIMVNSTILNNMFLSSWSAPAPLDYPSTAVKVSFDEAILAYYINEKGMPDYNIQLDAQSFPEPKNRYFDGYSIVTESGAFYFFIPPMVTFVVLLSEIVREKEYKLRHGLSMAGMGPSAYWHSWFITGLVFSLIVSNSLILSGVMCDFDLFLHCPYPIILMLFTLFSIAMMFLAFLVSTFLKTTKAAYTASYAFILIGLVLQFFMSNIYIIYLFYSEDVPNWVVAIRTILALYPPFNFSKAFGDIALIASSHYSNSAHRWVSGDDYTWHDFVKTIHGKVSGTSYSVPPTIVTMVTLIGNAFMICILAWYFDHVVASNRGCADPLYFMFTKKYYGCKRKKIVKKINIEINKENNDPVTQEKIKVKELIEKKVKAKGIRLIGIDKVFKKHSYPSNEDIHAVNSMFLEIPNRQLLTLLGHNGAGKSTLINILTGLIGPSSGTANICGFDINEDMDEIRNILGVCPQHDILWNELTAKEHLVLYGRVKGMSYPAIYKEAEEILKRVNLLEEANSLVGTFSGGMKRRLSVAISGIGNPKVIILDEPTTGMDPINRRQAWKFIQELKQGRVLILTTHSMEEADVLSDRICVIVDGALKCIGTSLYLKNQYGDGYRITIITKDPISVNELIQKIMPSAIKIDSSGGSIVLGIHLNDIKEIGEFVKLMESKEPHEFEKLRELIDDWGLSHTTLEEVFMRVTGKKQSKLMIS